MIAFEIRNFKIGHFENGQLRKYITMKMGRLKNESLQKWVTYKIGYLADSGNKSLRNELLWLSSHFENKLIQNRSLRKRSHLKISHFKNKVLICTFSQEYSRKF